MPSIPNHSASIVYSLVLYSRNYFHSSLSTKHIMCKSLVKEFRLASWLSAVKRIITYNLGIIN